MASEQVFHFSNHDEVDNGEDPSFSGRQITIALIPHVTAGLSFLGSLYILIDIVRDKKKVQTMTYHRLMLGMSLSDIVASGFLFLSTWPIPKGTAGIYGAMGTTFSCSVQGFFIQLGGVATFLYNAYLALYYVLLTRYRWKERDFFRIEKIGHVFAVWVTFGTAIASLVLKLYNNANLWCWIAPLPLDCLNSIKNYGVSTCERGDNAFVYRIAFYFLWLWVAVIVVIVCLSLVLWTVVQQQRAMQKWNPERTFSKSNKVKSRSNTLVQEVAIQSFLYIGAFLLTAIFPSLVRMFQAKWNCTSTFYPLTLMTVTFFPLQGFWNFFIYSRPRFIVVRKDHPEWTFGQCLHYTLRRTLGCTLPKNDNDYKLGLKLDNTNDTATTSTERMSSTQVNANAYLDKSLDNEEEDEEEEEKGQEREEAERQQATAMSNPELVGHEKAAIV